MTRRNRYWAAEPLASFAKDLNQYLVLGIHEECAQRIALVMAGLGRILSHWNWRSVGPDRVAFDRVYLLKADWLRVLEAF